MFNFILFLLEMKADYLIKLLLVFAVISLSFINSKENKKKKKSETKTKSKPKSKSKSRKSFDIPSIMEWAKKNNIYINENLTLNKNSNDRDFYYFTANKTIKNNTLLLKIPYNMTISQSNIDNYLKSIKHKKFEHLWDKILELENDYIKYYTTKQLFYMAVLVENAVNKQKGHLYNTFKEYLSMYEDVNLDRFPIFYEMDEKYYLSGSSFGSQIARATESLNEEYYLLTNYYNITSTLEDEFLKYRILILANSIDFNNTNLNISKGFNDTIVVPFIDCFNKAIAKNRSNAYYIVKGVKTDKVININYGSNNTNGTNSTHYFNDYYIEIYSKDEIKSNSEIYLQWRIFSNAESLLYYGFVEEGNPIKPRYYIDIINRKFKEDLGFKEDKEFQIQRYLYELITEFYDASVINSYRTIAKEVPKYDKTEEGPYEMMLDNLQYYLNLYDYPLNDGTVNRYINKQKNIDNIKEILHLEKSMLSKKVERLREIIAGIQIRNSKSGKGKSSEDKKEQKDLDKEKQKQGKDQKTDL